MTLKQRLTDDMKAAMKSGDKATLGVIRLANAAIKQREVDERIELDDAAVLAVLEKMVKQRKDSVSQFEAANREDLAAIERAEIVVIQGRSEEHTSELQSLMRISYAVFCLKKKKKNKKKHNTHYSIDTRIQYRACT